VLVDRERCTGCGVCVERCPGSIPFLHPKDGKAVICDLCGGDPECVKVCQGANFDALSIIRPTWTVHTRKLFARTPEDLTRDVALNLYGEKAEELM
jgi:Fe-S-cluster-containing dehydrogenase component